MTWPSGALWNPRTSSSSTRTAVVPAFGYESDTRRRFSRPGISGEPRITKQTQLPSVRAATVAGRQPDAPLTRSVDSGGFGATLGRLIRVFRSNKGREVTTEQRGVFTVTKRADFRSKANSKTGAKTSAVATVQPLALFSSPVLLAGEDDATSQPRPHRHKPGRYYR